MKRSVILCFLLVMSSFAFAQGSDEEWTLPKLEAAATQYPENAAIHFNLGNAYTREAFSIDANGRLADKPTNFTDLFTKAESAYKKALDLSPEEADYNYNMGILYYTHASWYITQSLKDGVDDKRYSELETNSIKEMRKGLPYFEQGYRTLNSKTSLTDHEKDTFKGFMIALREIYSRTKQPHKQAEIEATIERWK